MKDNFMERLPPAVRAKYQETSSRMTPTLLAMSFGLMDPMAEEPRVPRTQAAQEVERVAKQALQAWRNIHDSHWASVADQTADKTTAFLRSAKFAKQQLAMVQQAQNRALDLLEEKGAHLKTVLGNARRPPTGQGDAAIDAEVRAMIRAETDPGKAMAIAQAHPRAIASLPAGIGAALVGESGYKAMVRAHLQQTEPDALADQDDLVAALKQLTQATSTLEKEAKGLIDFNNAERMESMGNWQPQTQGEAA